VTPRPVRSTAFALGIALFSLALVGCLRQSARSSAGIEDPAQPAAAAITHSPRPEATGESLEGKFTYETMDSYVDAIVPMVTQWIKGTWPGMPLPRVVYVPKGARGPEECRDSNNRTAIYTTQSYEYCGAGQTVYVGQDMLWTFYQETGDAGPAVGLAHEFGHHVQQQLGVPAPNTAAQSTRHENQADCLAGAWTQYTDQHGWLEYPDDIQDIDSLFPLIGSAEGPGRDHGTATERSRAFQNGFSRGVKACEVFYPGTPLLS
jgi:hypothetical protein